MKLIKTLLVAGLLTTGLAACADYYDAGPSGYDYAAGYRHYDGPDRYWDGGHRYCRSLSDPDAFYRCDPY